MAKYEAHLAGNFDDILRTIDSEILRKSMTAHFEDGSDFRMGNTQCAVRVYERYSAIGSNRVSLSVTLFGEQNQHYLSAVTSGGSQAVFFKINTLGEEAFLRQLVSAVQPFQTTG